MNPKSFVVGFVQQISLALESGLEAVEVRFRV